MKPETEQALRDLIETIRKDDQERTTANVNYRLILLIEALLRDKNQEDRFARP